MQATEILAHNIVNTLNDDELGYNQEALKKATQEKPYDARAHYKLSRAYAGIGLYQKAIEAYNQVIDRKPFILIRGLQRMRIIPI